MTTREAAKKKANEILNDEASVQTLCYAKLTRPQLEIKSSLLAQLIQEVFEAYSDNQTVTGTALTDYRMSTAHASTRYAIYESHESTGVLDGLLDMSKVPVHALIANVENESAVLVVPLVTEAEMYFCFYMTECEFGETSQGEIRLTGGSAMGRGIFHAENFMMLGSGMFSMLMHGTPAHHVEIQNAIKH